MDDNVKWIWAWRDSYNTYNDAIVAVKNFLIDGAASAQLTITADSWYRLFINGNWIADGPSRAWPERYSYDVFDVHPFLHNGENEIRVMVRYFGCGTFHSVPQQAGLAVQLEVLTASGRKELIRTDSSWRIADAVMLKKNTPKISIQMEPAEVYDATTEDQLQFKDAVELYPVSSGPWRHLRERAVAYLTRDICRLASFVKVSAVAPPERSFSIAHTRLMNPELIEGNGRVFSPFGIATELMMTSAGEVSFERSRFDRGFFKIAVDGQIVDAGEKIYLSEGSHFVLGFARNILNNDKTISVTLTGGDRFSLKNPLDSTHENPWCYIPFRDYSFVQNDMIWRWFSGPLSEGKDQAYEQVTDALLLSVHNQDDLREQLGARTENLLFDEMFVEDAYLDFFEQQKIKEIKPQVKRPEALMDDDEFATVVSPCAGAVELVYDLGVQRCGYYSFDLTAAPGEVVDIFSVEYIHPNGKVQFTGNNRNGLRYITRRGENRYTSLKRRSGRYLLITLRGIRDEVRIRNVKLIESTYPVADSMIFSCSDDRLNKITEISARTLKLCMEDVYTDCPLYEQTLWVGDLRNEALYGYYAFGATDIAKNSLLLAAESAERYGMIGAQVPSCWDMILPAWSFLWGIAVWEYFWYTGDTDSLAAFYPSMVKNINSAEKWIGNDGLFSAPYWNFFDWAKIDQEHQTVFHNNMIFIGALRAAALCAKQMNDFENEAHFQKMIRELISSINRFWDQGRGSYPDSRHADGSASPSISQHTSFLALLYDVIDPAKKDIAVSNMLNPPAGMVQVGSPFAAMYLYEALEKAGCHERLIRCISDAYGPMLDTGATTAWESYPQGTLAKDDFPTRSHCHGWSASPMYFFQRIILGVRQTGAGGVSFEISPRLCGLTEAKGIVKTINGDLSVSWWRDGKQLFISWQCPSSVVVVFKNNETLNPFSVRLNH